MLAPSATSLSPHNPLNQFAEITLAASMATQKGRTRHHDILLAQYLSQLQGQLDLTPSNSPSPPPAHLSPSLKTHLKADILPPLSNPYGIGKQKIVNKQLKNINKFSKIEKNLPSLKHILASPT